MGLLFKRAGIEDIDILVSTRIKVLKTINELDNSVDLRKLKDECYDYYKSALKTNEHIAYLVYDGDDVVATGAASIYRVTPTYSNQTGRKAYIMNIFTKPSHRRQRIAYRVLDKLIQDIKIQGVNDISLEATDMGRNLYEKYGFIKMEHEMNLK